MTLKLIPIEEKSKSFLLKKRKSILKIIRTRLAVKDTDKSRSILKKACFSIMNFLSNEGHMKVSDLNRTVKELERSIMLIQASKKKLIEKESKKK